MICLSKAFALIYIFFILCFASPKGGWLATQSPLPLKSAKRGKLLGSHFEKQIQPNLYLKQSTLAVFVVVPFAT